MKVYSTRKGAMRVAMSAAVLGVMLGGCSSVPDVVNPAKWYEKTTDFFSGDSQAASTAPAEGENQGLAADPQAPAPAAAPVQKVTSVPGGLSADQTSSNYASPPIDRQGAASDVLRPESAVAAVQPPKPVAQPTMPVMPAPIAAPVAAPAPASAPMAPVTMAQAAPSAPPAPSMPILKRPASMSMAGAPPPPTFNAPANATAPFGGDEFETVVISADGMETLPQLRSQPQAQAKPQAASGALFPEPGTTTLAQAGSVSPAGMTRVATIHFANNSSILDARDRSILGAVIQLQKERGGQVVVVGHASSRTKDMDYITHRMVNFEISMERAASIGNELKGLGLAGETLEVQAVSDSTPLYMEVMPSGEAGNRRVEIYLTL